MSRQPLLVFVGIVVLSIVVFPESVRSASFQSQTASPSGDANTRVAAIMDGILKRGEGHIGDVQTNTWVPPTPEDFEKIREIGDAAISPLNQELESRLPFRQLLAVKLLGAIGGPDIVAPLKRALEPDKQNSVRMASLAALRSAPDEMALPLIRSSLHDSDPLIAQRARDLLINYYHLRISE